MDKTRALPQHSSECGCGSDCGCGCSCCGPTPETKPTEAEVDQLAHVGAEIERPLIEVGTD